MVKGGYQGPAAAQAVTFGDGGLKIESVVQIFLEALQIKACRQAVFAVELLQVTGILFQQSIAAPGKITVGVALAVDEFERAVEMRIGNGESHSSHNDAVMTKKSDFRVEHGAVMVIMHREPDLTLKSGNLYP